MESVQYPDECLILEEIVLEYILFYLYYKFYKRNP